MAYPKIKAQLEAAKQACIEEQKDLLRSNAKPIAIAKDIQQVQNILDEIESVLDNNF